MTLPNWYPNSMMKDTSLEESIGALNELRRAGKTKYIGLSECSAETLRRANASSFDCKYLQLDMKLCANIIQVAKIDAVQAEYSAFETLHEASGLIDTAKQLGVAFVAFSPLGHGWLVDDFQFKSPDDFAPSDFRRTGMLLLALCSNHHIRVTDPSQTQCLSSKVKTSTRTRLSLTKLRS